MKVEIPKELKAEMPPTTFGRILSATPVVMAVVATMLAGLASSEMTRAQYARSLAAQQQSKAGDQWSFFQDKRLRGDFQLNTVEFLQALRQVRPFEAAALKKWAEGKPDVASILESPAGEQALGFLQQTDRLRTSAAPAWATNIQAALQGMEASEPAAEMARLLKQVEDQTLEEAVRAARDRVEAFDSTTEPINKAVEQLDRLVARYAAETAGAVGESGPSVKHDFTAPRLRYTCLLYTSRCV